MCAQCSVFIFTFSFLGNSSLTPMMGFSYVKQFLWSGNQQTQRISRMYASQQLFNTQITIDYDWVKRQWAAKFLLKSIHFDTFVGASNNRRWYHIQPTNVYVFVCSCLVDTCWTCTNITVEHCNNSIGITNLFFFLRLAKHQTASEHLHPSPAASRFTSIPDCITFFAQSIWPFVLFWRDCGRRRILIGVNINFC